MTPIIQLDPDFAFEGIPPIEDAVAVDATPQAADPLGPLAQLTGPAELPGTWKGNGFNAIWRPHHPANPQDRFLELNLTTETLVFTRINGPIPNRGLEMPDINMFGLTYLQQIQQTSDLKGLHIEPGIWANVPQTTDPAEPPTVVRMASIPHGAVMLAQGKAQVLAGGPQQIPDNNILPFFVGTPPPANTDFDAVAATFTELDLSTPTAFRFESPGVTQDMVKNPNSVLQTVLQASLQGTTMKSRTFLHVATTDNPIKGGGGTANTAFLAAGSNPPGGNAKAVEVDATFWIETIAGTGGKPDTLQLQYTQLVQLDFNGIRWPHVTVGTLRKQ
ncbi:MAG: heme-binding protein [Solirubrobacteraceae bacterium]